MWMSFGPEITKRLDEYLSDAISREQFEDWFHRATLNLDLQDWPADASLVWAIKLRLAEFTSGHMSEDELRIALREVAQEYENTHATTDHTHLGAMTITESLLSVDTPA